MQWNVDHSRHNIEDVAVGYDALPKYDPKAVHAWKQLADESKKHADYIRQHLNITETDNPEPYNTSADMIRDIRDNRNFVVSTANADHPVWTPQDNINFRIVHDVFGHAATDGDFGWHGENDACSTHFALSSPHAQKALATECLGQTGYAIHRGRFTDQRVGFIPGLHEGLAAANKDTPIPTQAQLMQRALYGPFKQSKRKISNIDIPESFAVISSMVDHFKGTGLIPVASANATRTINAPHDVSYNEPINPMSTNSPSHIIAFWDPERGDIPFSLEYKGGNGETHSGEVKEGGTYINAIKMHHPAMVDIGYSKGPKRYFRGDSFYLHEFGKDKHDLSNEDFERMYEIQNLYPNAGRRILTWIQKNLPAPYSAEFANKKIEEVAKRKGLLTNSKWKISESQDANRMYRQHTDGTPVAETIFESIQNEDTSQEHEDEEIIVNGKKWKKVRRKNNPQPDTYKDPIGGWGFYSKLINQMEKQSWVIVSTERAKPIDVRNIEQYKIPQNYRIINDIVPEFSRYGVIPIARMGSDSDTRSLTEVKDFGHNSFSDHTTYHTIHFYDPETNQIVYGMQYVLNGPNSFEYHSNDDRIAGHSEESLEADYGEHRYPTYLNSIHYNEPRDNTYDGYFDAGAEIYLSYLDEKGHAISPSRYKQETVNNFNKRYPRLSLAVLRWIKDELPKPINAHIINQKLKEKAQKQDFVSLSKWKIAVPPAEKAEEYAKGYEKSEEPTQEYLEERYKWNPEVRGHRWKLNYKNLEKVLNHPDFPVKGRYNVFTVDPKSAPTDDISMRHWRRTPLGTHEAATSNNAGSIHINPLISAESANEALWHELQHAYQDQEGRFTQELRDSYFDPTDISGLSDEEVERKFKENYLEHPMEIDANKFADFMRKYPLIEKSDPVYKPRWINFSMANKDVDEDVKSIIDKYYEDHGSKRRLPLPSVESKWKISSIKLYHTSPQQNLTSLNPGMTGGYTIDPSLKQSKWEIANNKNEDYEEYWNDKVAIVNVRDPITGEWIAKTDDGTANGEGGWDDKGNLYEHYQLMQQVLDENPEIKKTHDELQGDDGIFGNGYLGHVMRGIYHPPTGVIEHLTHPDWNNFGSTGWHYDIKQNFQPIMNDWKEGIEKSGIPSTGFKIVLDSDPVPWNKKSKWIKKEAPARSKAQYRYMQGICNGSIEPPEGMIRAQACEYVKGQSSKGLPEKKSNYLDGYHSAVIYDSPLGYPVMKYGKNERVIHGDVFAPYTHRGLYNPTTGHLIHMTNPSEYEKVKKEWAKRLKNGKIVIPEYITGKNNFDSSLEEHQQTWLNAAKNSKSEIPIKRFSLMYHPKDAEDKDVVMFNEKIDPELVNLIDEKEKPQQLQLFDNSSPKQKDWDNWDGEDDIEIKFANSKFLTEKRSFSEKIDFQEKIEKSLIKSGFSEKAAVVMALDYMSKLSYWVDGYHAAVALRDPETDVWHMDVGFNDKLTHGGVTAEYINDLGTKSMRESVADKDSRTHYYNHHTARGLYNPVTKDFIHMSHPDFWDETDYNFKSLDQDERDRMEAFWKQLAEQTGIELDSIRVLNNQTGHLEDLNIADLEMPEEVQRARRIYERKRPLNSWEREHGGYDTKTGSVKTSHWIRGYNAAIINQHGQMEIAQSDPDRIYYDDEDDDEPTKEWNDTHWDIGGFPNWRGLYNPETKDLIHMTSPEEYHKITGGEGEWYNFAENNRPEYPFEEEAVNPEGHKDVWMNAAKEAGIPVSSVRFMYADRNQPRKNYSQQNDETDFNIKTAHWINGFHAAIINQHGEMEVASPTMKKTVDSEGNFFIEEDDSPWYKTHWDIGGRPEYRGLYNHKTGELIHMTSPKEHEKLRGTGWEYLDKEEAVNPLEHETFWRDAAKQSNIPVNDFKLLYGKQAEDGEDEPPPKHWSNPLNDKEDFDLTDPEEFMPKESKWKKKSHWISGFHSAIINQNGEMEVVPKGGEKAEYHDEDVNWKVNHWQTGGYPVYRGLYNHDTGELIHMTSPTEYANSIEGKFNERPEYLFTHEAVNPELHQNAWKKAAEKSQIPINDFSLLYSKPNYNPEDDKNLGWLNRNKKEDFNLVKPTTGNPEQRAKTERLLKDQAIEKFWNDALLELADWLLPEDLDQPLSNYVKNIQNGQEKEFNLTDTDKEDILHQFDYISEKYPDWGNLTDLHIIPNDPLLKEGIIEDMKRVADLWKTFGQPKTSGETKKKRLERASQLPEDTSEIVHTFENGWTIKELKTIGDMHREGELMDNCLSCNSDFGPYRGWNDSPEIEEDPEFWKEEFKSSIGNEGHFFSLRDENNLPHATYNADWQDDEYRYDPENPENPPLGRHNSDIKDEYVPYWKVFFDQYGINHPWDQWASFKESKWKVSKKDAWEAVLDGELGHDIITTGTWEEVKKQTVKWLKQLKNGYINKKNPHDNKKIDSEAKEQDGHALEDLKLYKEKKRWSFHFDHGKHPYDLIIQPVGYKESKWKKIAIGLWDLENTEPSRYFETKAVEEIPVDVAMQMLDFERGKEDYERENINNLTKHISEHGFLEPIIVEFNKDTNTAYIAEGNHRVQVAKKLGMEWIPARGIRGYGKTHFKELPAYWQGNQTDALGNLYIPPHFSPHMIGIPVKEKVKGFEDNAFYNGWETKESKWKKRSHWVEGFHAAGITPEGDMVVGPKWTTYHGEMETPKSLYKIFEPSQGWRGLYNPETNELLHLSTPSEYERFGYTETAGGVEDFQHPHEHYRDYWQEAADRSGYPLNGIYLFSDAEGNANPALPSNKEDFELSKIGKWKIARKTKTRLLQDAKDLDENYTDTSDIVHTFDDGWTIRKLNTIGDAHREGTLMSNCMTPEGEWPPPYCDVAASIDPNFSIERHHDFPWEDYFDKEIRRDDKAIYSLRDPENLPHATYDSGGATGFDSPILGRHNDLPKPEYRKYWDKWFAAKGKQPFRWNEWERQSKWKIANKNKRKVHPKFQTSLKDHQKSVRKYGPLKTHKVRNFKKRSVLNEQQAKELFAEDPYMYHDVSAARSKDGWIEHIPVIDSIFKNGILPKEQTGIAEYDDWLTSRPDHVYIGKKDFYSKSRKPALRVDMSKVDPSTLAPDEDLFPVYGYNNNYSHLIDFKNIKSPPFEQEQHQGSTLGDWMHEHSHLDTPKNVKASKNLIGSVAVNGGVPADAIHYNPEWLEEVMNDIDITIQNAETGIEDENLRVEEYLLSSIIANAEKVPPEMLDEFMSLYNRIHSIWGT